jgi:creatinine amidohydrolase
MNIYGGKVKMGKYLSSQVQMELMRPGELESAMRKFPVVYIPFGLIEWHGRHLPLGNDALKAHAILVKCAEKFGGVVYPPVYFHAKFDQHGHLTSVLTELFQRLRKMGFKVIIGISGHNVKEQIEMIEKALQPVVVDKKVAGFGGWEITLSRSKDSDTDHAAKWETSNMLFLYPERVALSELGEGEMNLDMKPPSGIGGLDPRIYASPEVGKRNVELAAEAIGEKAKELLASLPPTEQTPEVKISPEYWWSI